MLIKLYTLIIHMKKFVFKIPTLKPFYIFKVEL